MAALNADERAVAAPPPAPLTDAERAAPTPPSAPLAMPTQPIKGVARKRPRRQPLRVALARLIAFGGGAALTVYGTREMWAAVSLGKTSALQYALVVLFALTFGWIAFSGAASLAALLPLRAPRRVRGSGALPQLTALVMPVYNEDPSETAAGLHAMAEGLLRAGHGDAFEIFLASDTNDPEVWVKETAAFQALRERLAGRMQVWYRRRPRNPGRKAGNIEELIKRFGGRYEALVMLDADSLVAPDTLIEMARELVADERLALLQSVPCLAGGRGLLARLQQFAGRVHGPAIARSVSAWSGDDGNYWGHNAILRTRAFAEACGLPTLPGRKPFGGSILSHDFVEAALLRRAGWAVRMEPTLGGSYEASPPTLLDVAVRDRRWAQGNLQHAGVLRASGLATISRAHLVMGILSYLASPLWLALMLVGVLLALTAALTDPVYFSKPFQLFPDWPIFDAERMIDLFVLALVTLLLPKLIGTVRALCIPALRRDCGGGVALVSSTVLEVLISSLYAPVLMLMQTRQIAQILLGRDAGWSVQRRAGGCTPWSQVWQRHTGHVFAGVVTTGVVWFASPTLVAWMSPTLLGLIGAACLSRWSGSVGIGQALRRAKLFVIPEETSPPEILRARDAALPGYRQALEGVDLDLLAADPLARRRHFDALEPWPASPPGQPDVERLTARAKLADATSLEQALGWLDKRERLVLLSEPEMFDKLVGASAGER
ncbi:MAG: glucans biosynthesis glucosyltransferase H [Planctomycetota bacterium]|nr:MAG: glucans biosynthesis glucosyltransferase H [Planctomycetota bacterium]